MRIPESPNSVDSNMGDFPPCVVCGREVRAPFPAMVHVVDGGGTVATDDESVEEASDLGCYPVGPGCLRRFPELKPYILK